MTATLNEYEYEYDYEYEQPIAYELELATLGLLPGIISFALICLYRQLPKFLSNRLSKY